MFNHIVVQMQIQYSSIIRYVYQAFLKPGDTILGMDLSSGGHLSHGSKPNISGKVYDAHYYGVDKEGWLDYNAIREQAKNSNLK